MELGLRYKTHEMRARRSDHEGIVVFALNGRSEEFQMLRVFIARASERIEKCFRSSEPERLRWEQSLRLEEQRRERERIARELHDTLLQGFLGASLQLHEAVRQMPDDSPSKASLTRTLCLIRRVIDEGRDALQGLRLSGIASMNLEQALAVVRDELALGQDIRFRVFVTGRPTLLKPSTREQVYLIGREALVNALRHSQATSVETKVEYLPRRLRVVIRDNGCGIDPDVVRSGKAAHWGLAGMRERAENIGARLRIWSRPGAGTEVEISVPSTIAADAYA